MKYAFNLPKLMPRMRATGYPAVVVHPDAELAEYCSRHRFESIMVPPDDRDVTRQLRDAMKRLEWDYAALVCGDSPCVSPRDVKYALQQPYRKMWMHPQYLGLWVRTFPYHAIQGLMDSREHGVTPFWQPSGRMYSVELGERIDLSVDTPEDAEFIRKIYNRVPWDAPPEEILKCASEIRSSDPATPVT